MTTFRRLLLLAATLTMVATLGACAANDMARAREADDMREYDLAVARYTNVLRKNPKNTEARAGLDRAKLRASEAHVTRGRHLLGQGHYEEAAAELQLAVELNPLNTAAEAELRSVRAALRAQMAASASDPTALESLLTRTRDAAPAGPELPDMKLPAQIATGPQMTNRLLYLMLGRLGGLSVTFDPQFHEAPAQVSLLSNMTLRQALDAVAGSTATFYRVTGPATITVYPDTPTLRREYTEEVVRMLVVQNADLKETVDALRVVLDARSLSQISGTNMIVMRDTPERVAAAARFIAAFDKARPEVVVDVEVLEVSRTRLREYAADASYTDKSSSGDGTAPQSLTLQNLRNLTAADIITTNIPALYYRLLKTDDRTRTLANPHLRIMDGVTASANFGEDVPVPRTIITPIAQGGVSVQPQTSFDYRTIGVNIGITPRTHPNDEVTLALKIELSSLAGTGYEDLPKFGQRHVETSIRLRDGQTNVLAGLIREDERWVKETLFGIGTTSEVSLIGRLFTRSRKEAEETDVVIMLTPHIVRVLDLSDTDLRPFAVSREGAGGLPGGIPAALPAGRGGGGGKR